ncbi:MAG: phosphotransferase [Patescibacteria group bacterium]
MEQIKKILKEYNLIETEPIKPVRESMDNAVYVIGDKDKKILRISKRLPFEDIRFEYEATSYLFKNDLPVARWLLNRSGDFYTLIDGAVAVMFEFLNGHHILIDKDHLPTLAQAFNAGKELGLMSNVAAGFNPSSPRKRDIFTEFNRVISVSDIFIKNFEGGKEFIAQVKAAMEFGKSQIEVNGLIHNDYRSGNILFNGSDSVSGIIDFDWSCMGPIVKDLALAVVEWSFPDGRIEPDWKLFDVFLAGYNSIAKNKYEKGVFLYSWIKFACISDSCTYFCDLANDINSTTKVIKSYMYRKYLFFSNL